jgi:hypothetical protein
MEAWMLGIILIVLLFGASFLQDYFFAKEAVKDENN